MRTTDKEGFAVFVVEVHHKFGLNPSPEVWVKFDVQLYEVLSTRHMAVDEPRWLCRKKLLFSFISSVYLLFDSIRATQSTF